MTYSRCFYALSDATWQFLFCQSLTLVSMGDFQTRIDQSALRGSKDMFSMYFFIWASASKSFERSRIFGYELPKDILSKGQKNQTGLNYNSFMLAFHFFSRSTFSIP